MIKQNYIKIEETLYPIPVLPFGVEIECYCPVDAGWGGMILSRDDNIGDDVIPIHVEKSTGWMCTEDLSLGCLEGADSWEYISPVMTGRYGAMGLVNMCNRLNKIGALTDEETGMHVHIDTRHRECINAEIREIALWESFLQMQEVMFGIVDLDRHDNEECEKIQFGKNPYKRKNHYCGEFPHFAKKEYWGNAVCSAHIKDRGDFQFRLFHGSTDAVEILHQSCISSRMVYFSLEQLNEKIDPDNQPTKYDDIIEIVQGIDFMQSVENMLDDKILYDYYQEKSRQLDYRSRETQNNR